MDVKEYYQSVIDKNNKQYSESLKQLHKARKTNFILTVIVGILLVIKAILVLVIISLK